MRLLIPLLIAVAATNSAAQPNLSDRFRPVIAGVQVHCRSAGTGQPVAFVPNPYLNDIGRSRPGFPPTIELNPVLLAQLPRALQLFWYGHECAHHVLGHTIGNFGPRSEADADCWAVKTGRDQGLFDRNDVTAFGPYFLSNPGSPWGHLPGPARTANFLLCFDDSDRQGSRSRPRATDRDDDRCKYRNDGECDEPDVCPRGSDSEDCARTREARRRRDLPRYCCTDGGRLGPYPNPGSNGIVVELGGLCQGLHPVFGPMVGTACE